MICILDTNVLSEVMKPTPSAAVASWMRRQPLRSLFTAAICHAEILAGIAVLPRGRRRAEFEAMAAAMFAHDFDGRILPFDSEAATFYASLFADRRQIGRPIATADLIVAATARAHEAIVVTRDVGGFEGCGLTLVNPWEA
ncbi:MAG TPA: type II toxin-antitoxin system VapC family toxin [Methylocystis sp.]|nr:type II toxin-antitoxin system VapC family toxin [Methylocystis sp.]